MNERRGILQYAEAVQGKADKRSLLALGKVRDLAGELGVYVEAMVAGGDVDAAAKELIAFGARKVIAVKDAKFDEYDSESLLALLTAIIEQRNPEAVAFADTFAAKDLGPRLAQRFGTSYVARCTTLGVDVRERKVVQTRKAFGGKVTMRILTTVDEPQMFSIMVDPSAEPFEAEYARGEVVEWTGQPGAPARPAYENRFSKER